tara:strand:- start:713 stop:1531 length:819 start_codon:yes stop_codon:yes gene_type:complete
MSYTTRDKKTHGSFVLMGENGLPVDTIATISGSYVFIEGTSSLSYNAGGATVTLPAGSDLTPVTTARARYTGKYILLTSDNSLYYIDRKTIDVANRTFQISNSDKAQITPASIDLSSGWQVAEADIVNRVATTSAAKFDSIEFRDLQFQMELDGDPVTVRGENGNTLEPNPDGSINARIQGTAAGSPTILNTNMPVANFEYSIDLPITVRRFTIKSREPALIKVSYSPSSASYITIKPGVVYSEENLVTSTALSLYIRSNKNDTVIETVFWE